MNKKFDICYLISHGFSARMIFQTGLADKLVEKGLKVAIISPDADDKNLKMFCQRSEITIFEYKNQKNIWADNYLVIRKYFLEDIRKNPALWSKHVRSVKYNKSKNPWKKVRPHLYYFIYFLSNKISFIRTWFKNNELRFLDNRNSVNLLKEINPKILVATYPVNLFEATFLNAANLLNIQTVIHLLSWDNITCKGYFPVLAKKYVAWGKVMSDELKEYYNVPEKDIQECGVPHFDHHIKVKNSPTYQPYLTQLNLDPSKPYLFFTMSAPYFCPHEIDIVEYIAKNIEEGVYGKDIQFIVRPHPQNVQGNMADQDWLPRLNKIAGPKVAVDYPNLVKSKLPWSMNDTDMDKMSNLLYGCSICLNSGSTISIESLIMDKPVILTSFDGNEELPYYKSAKRLVDYIHLKKLVIMKGVKVAYNYQEMDHLIKTYINYPTLDLEERRKALINEVGEPGEATIKVVDYLKSLV